MIFKKRHSFDSSASSDWYIFVGLGNPGREYEHTRHNIGFSAVQQLAKRWSIDISRYKFKALTGAGVVNGKHVALVMPQTYMNNSGVAVGSFVNFYKIELTNLVIINDDMDLPFGNIRIRRAGGSAGQRGMQSIINRLGSEDFPRVRLGIGRPPGRMDPKDYVLKKFKGDEEIILDQVLDNCGNALEVFLDQGIDKAMTLFNGSVLNDDE
jgi:PTH1 family peptidyl-tRNA hydrolase